MTNAEWSPQGGGKVVATNAPYLKRSNFGCWRYKGTATALHKFATWTGLGVQTISNLVFEVNPAIDNLAFQFPGFPDTLRVGWHILASTGTDYTFTASYTPSLCSVSAGPATFPLQFPTDFGVLQTNAFPELKATDAALQRWLANPARSYTAALASTRQVATTISGSPGCNGTGTEDVGTILFTNAPAASPPLVNPNGEMKDSHTETSFSWTWSLQPQSQP